MSQSTPARPSAGNLAPVASDDLSDGFVRHAPSGRVQVPTEQPVHPEAGLPVVISRRQAAIHASRKGATQFALMAVVYDALTFHLEMAAGALQRGDHTLCRQHADRGLLLVEHLQRWTGRLQSTQHIPDLEAFYAALQAGLMQGSELPCAAGFLRLTQEVQAARRSWQQKRDDLLGALA